MKNMVKIARHRESEPDDIVYINPDTIITVEPFVSTRNWSIRSRVTFNATEGGQGWLFSTEGPDDINKKITEAL